MDSSIQPQLCQSVCNKNGWLDIVALPSQMISTYKPTPHFILENEEIWIAIDDWIKRIKDGAQMCWLSHVRRLAPCFMSLSI